MSLHNRPMNKAAIVARTEVMHGLSYMALHLPRPSWLRQSQSAQIGNSRDEHWAPCMVPFPGELLIIFDHFHHGRGSVLFLIEYLLWIYICLLCMQIFCPNYHSVGLQNA